MELGTIILLVLWGAFASSVVVRLRRAGANDFLPPITPRKHRLVGSAALYLGTPAAVLASQLVQIGLLTQRGVSYTFTSWVYWGVVHPAPADALPPLERAAIAAAGPATLALIALLAFAWTKARPADAAKNLVRLELGRFAMTLSLGIHPIASIALERGDYWTIRTALDEVRPSFGDATLLGIGVVAALSFWSWRRATKLRALASSGWDADRMARRRLRESPDDPDALLHFGRTQLSNGDPAAIETLEKALLASPDDPHVELWLGRANLLRGEAQEASSHLRRAGELLEGAEEDDEPLLFAILFHLAEARMALGDGEGAVLTAEAACAQRPNDTLGLLLCVDALVASGRAQDARDRLTRALATAEGRAAKEIERRLAALRRR
ncbi:MAG: hypothetical protein H6719_05765 [Sandaracinaceae bacterium]|nr:hypothetical protein [Sandaracinaceae bacterium]